MMLTDSERIAHLERRLSILADRLDWALIGANMALSSVEDGNHGHQEAIRRLTEKLTGILNASLDEQIKASPVTQVGTDPS